MATELRLRYIYAGSRLIFVEQPDSDKYRIVHSDLVLGQSLVGFISPDCRFSGSQTGITLGSATETQTFSDPQFAEMQGRILIPHTAIGYAHISRFGSVSRGLALDHAAGPLNTESKLGEAKDKLTTPSTAKLINTRTKLTGAKEKILTEQKNKTFETSDPKFNGSISEMSAGNKVEGKTTEAKMSKAQSGASAGQSADATVDTPPQPTQYIIYAGTYTGKSQISSLEEFDIAIPISYQLYGESGVSSATWLWGGHDFGPESISINAFNDNPPHWEGDYLGWASVEDGSVLAMLVSEEFTVTADTTVTASEYSAFNRYFQLVTP